MDAPPNTLEVDLPSPAGGALGSAGAHQRRVFARAFDLLIFLALARAFEPVGAALGLTYILVADACWRGQSPGKRLFGVTVLRIPPGVGAGLSVSLLRNLPLAVALLLLLVPVVALVLFPLLGLPLLLAETWLTRVGPRGRRMGDVLGDCYVADVWRAPTRPDVLEKL
jgi:uncharacterized RDD family membrane protein YckC